MDPVSATTLLVIFSTAVIVGILLWKLRPDLQAEARYRELQRRYDAQAQELHQARTDAAVAAQRADDAASLNKTMHQEGENLHEKVHVLIASETKATHAKEEALRSLALSEERLREMTARFESAQAANAALKEAAQKKEALPGDEETSSAARDAGALAGSVAEVRRTVQAMTESEESGSQFSGILSQIQKHLREYEAVLEGLRRETREAASGLRQEIQALQWAEQRLHTQALAFGDAVGGPSQSGSGLAELQLHQLVEFVGMQEYCEFTAQPATAEGRRTPDMIVHLPKGQQVTVDAKADMSASRDAAQAASEEERARLLALHVENVKERIDELASQAYRDSRDSPVEVTVLFLPGENQYATAMENDMALIQYALERDVVVCGPNSLMMLMKVVSQIWQRAAVTAEAERIRRIGINVYRHACKFVTKYSRLGESIHKVTADYDAALGALDRRLLPASRRLSGLENANEDALAAPVLSEQPARPQG